MPDDLVVHFKRPLDWRNTINIHYWNVTPTAEATTWPGVAMTDTGNDWFVYSFKEIKGANMVFNDDAGKQTGDLRRDNSGWYYYDNQWDDENPEKPKIQKTTTQPKQNQDSETRPANQTTESTTLLNWPVQAWEEMSHFVDRFLPSDFPAVDIVEQENDILIRAELPGVQKEDLQVNIGHNAVTITGGLSPEPPEEGKYIRREITHQTPFSRTLTLPTKVVASQSKAKFKGNVLELILPKRAKRYSLKVD
jgi:HSP20 family molecular chaperone IbpA